MSAPIRLGIVGLGNFGLLHAQTALALSEVELVTLVDRDASRFDILPGALSSLPCFVDIKEAIEEVETDAWIIASSTASHVPLAKKLLKAGKSVLLEKPIASDLASAMSLDKTVNTSTARLMLGHLVLFNSEFRQLLAETDIRGPLTYLDFVRHRPVSTMDALPNEDPFHLIMVHDLYLALALKTGEEPVEIKATCHRDKSGNCDLALAQMRWADGTLARFTASFLTPSGLGPDGFDRLEVFGDGWSARLSPNPRPLELWAEKAHWPLTLDIRVGANQASGMLAEQLRHFAKVASGQDSVPAGATYADSLRIQKWLEKMVEVACHCPSE